MLEVPSCGQRVLLANLGRRFVRRQVVPGERRPLRAQLEADRGASPDQRD
jgi:hypothetical protein